jgi:capsular exopolysaccharide synthesis family protein
MRELNENKNAHFLEIEKPADTEISRPINFDAGVDYVDEPTLHDYWRSIRKHLFLAFGLPILCTLLVAIYLFRLPNLYEGDVSIQVDMENRPDLSPPPGNGVLQFDDRAYFNTQLQIIESPTVLRRVVKTLDLEHNQPFCDYYINNPSIKQIIKQNLGLKFGPPPSSNDGLVDPALSEATREELIEAKRLAPYVAALELAVVVTPVTEIKLNIKDTRLIQISFNHPDPQLAATVTNTLADALLQVNLQRISESSVTKGVFLQRRIGELQNEIRGGEEQLADYASNHQILSLENDQNTVVERLVGLNKQLLDAENDRKQAEAAYRAALAPGAAKALSEGTAKEIDSANIKLNELRAQRAQFLVGTTEKWPEVQEIDKQIEVLEKQVADSSGRATATVLTNLETRYRGTMARENALRSAFDQQRDETFTQNRSAINYRIIQQEIESNRNLLKELLQRSKENEVSAAGTPNNIHIVDYAVAQDQPAGPPRLLYLAVAFGVFLPLGVGSALLRDYLNTTVYTADDIEKWLNLPVLAVTPSIKGWRRNRLLHGTSISRLLTVHASSNPELLISADTRSMLAESYRQLRTSVLFSALGDALKTILVTSTQPSEGKTTVVVNLAISLAQHGANVLIIDADMRGSRMHSIFGLDNEQGLSTILSGEIIEGDITDIIQRHDASGLSVLTAGPEPHNPAELLGSERMRTLLTKVETMYTHIIIDSPPVGVLSDSAIVSPIADGVLVVVRSSKVSRDAARQSLKLLNFVGAKIIGVILNDVSGPDAAPFLRYRSRYFAE